MVGNNPNYDKVDILRCFLHFNKEVSRKELVASLNLGEGTIRTILDLLKSKRLLESTKKGHFLSREGEKELSAILGTITVPKKSFSNEVYPESCKIGTILQKSKNVEETYKLRDIAVKNGADGAVILMFDKKLFAPESKFISSFTQLEKEFQLSKGDVLIMGFSSNEKNAEKGALAIAAELNPLLKKFIEQFE